MREDFIQEVLMKLYDILINQRINLNHFRIVNRKIIFDNIYDAALLDKFIALSMENKILYNESALSEEHYIRFVREFATFVGKIKIISYLDKMIKNHLINFKKKHIFRHVEFEESGFPVYNNYLRLLDEIETSHHLFSRIERRVIEILKNTGFQATQKEIANELQVSQQFISKVLRIIKNKLKDIWSKIQLKFTYFSCIFLLFIVLI